METKADATVGRRDVLKALGAGTGLAAVSAAPLSIPAHADSESSNEKRRARYSETPHVKTYYAVNRYPK